MISIGRRLPTFVVAFALALALAVLAAPASADPFDLPRLPPGQQLGMWLQWVPVAPPARALLEAEWQRALDGGMSVGLFHNGWAALEPAPGAYAEDLLLDGLQDLEDDGLVPLITVSAVDIGSLDVPQDLLDPDDPDQLRDGLRLDDPLVLARHAAFLDWLVPHLTEAGAVALAVGVEVDVRCDDEHPEEAEETVSFLIAARDHVRTLDPDLAVAMTVTVGALEPGSPCGQAVLAESDFGSFTYYHVHPLLYSVLPLEDVGPRFDRLLEAVPGRQVILQELGCPGGWESRPSLIGSDPELQRRCFETFFSELAARPRIRAAVPFLQTDFQERYMFRLAREIFAGLPPFFGKVFAEGWTTMGLCRVDGSCKPAWEEFLAALEGDP